MKKFISIFSLLFLLTLSCLAQYERIPGSHYVQDFAGVFSASEKSALEQKMAWAEDSVAIQIAIATVDSIPFEGDIDLYATELFEAWGIGKAGVDNGLLILCAIGQRQMVMRTGYGTEAVLTDALCSQIIRKRMAPSFQEGKYYEGIDRATNDVISIVRGEFTPEEMGYDTSGEWTKADTIRTLIILFLIFVLPGIVLPKGKKSAYYGFLLSILVSVLTSGGGSSRGGGGRSFGGGHTGGGGARGSW